MKLKHIVILVLVAALSTMAFAQTQTKTLSSNNYQEILARDTEAMRIKLQLSDSQLTEVKRIEERLYVQLFSLTTDSAFLMGRKEKLQALQVEKQEALKTVLTPAQWLVYESYMTQQKQRAGERIEERRKEAEVQASGGQQD